MSLLDLTKFSPVCLNSANSTLILSMKFKLLSAFVESLFMSAIMAAVEL